MVATPSVLLVEDNDDEAELTRMAFELHGITDGLVRASDGIEALAYLERNAEKLPNLVLLDLKLPRVDGFEVLQRIRANERTRTIPVVILTSSDERQDVTRSYRLGANAYVRKPVSFKQFVEVAETIAAYWLTVNEPPQRAD